MFRTLLRKKSINKKVTRIFQCFLVRWTTTEIEIWVSKLKLAFLCCAGNICKISSDRTSPSAHESLRPSNAEQTPSLSTGKLTTAGKWGKIRFTSTFCLLDPTRWVDPPCQTRYCRTTAEVRSFRNSPKLQLSTSLNCKRKILISV